MFSILKGSFQALIKLLQCGDPSWSLWQNNGQLNGSWCCEAGMFGLDVPNVGVGCTSFGGALATNQVAATEATNPPSTCTTAVTTTTSIATSTTASSTDAASSSTDSASSSAQPHPGSSAGQGVAGQSTATAMPDVATTSNNIGGGAIAGIAIGAIAGIALIILAAWMVRRRAKPRSNEAIPAVMLQPKSAELGGTWHQPRVPGSETYIYNNSNYGPAELPVN
jgi:hypothetical protein